jgi:hypothetical protein
MAIQSILLDPNAQYLSDDAVVAKVNAASDNITRAGSVDAAARPIAAGEVTATELGAGAVTEAKIGAGAVTEAKVGAGAVTEAKIGAGAISAAKVATGVAKTNLDAMADTARGYIKTSPAVGQFRVIALERDADGKIKTEYDDVAIE